MSRIIFVVNDLAFFISHRLPLAIAAKEAGYEVHIATPRASAVAKMEQHGFIFHPLPLSRSGKNPLNELTTILAVYCLFKKIKPDLVHLVTIKPVLYGGIAARLARVPAVVAAVSGLGFVFMATDIKSRLIKKVVTVLYRFALGKEKLCVIFQNKDDRKILLNLNILSENKDIIIRGSGVDLTTCQFYPEQDGVPIVVMAARLLKDKGVWEFVEAAEKLKARGINAHFMLAGDIDTGNPASLTKDDLQLIRDRGSVELLGYCKDVSSLFSTVNIVVLPSYREGLPKVLIEAAACGRAVVTTDVAGCRDAIVKGKTGLLVPVRDSNALADAIERLISQPILRHSMGREGRLLAQKEFDIDNVVKKHLDLYHGLLRRE